MVKKIPSIGRLREACVRGAAQAGYLLLHPEPSLSSLQRGATIPGPANRIST